MCYLPKRKSFPVNENMDSNEREELCKKGERVFRVRDGKYRSRAHSKREKTKQNKAWRHSQRIVISSAKSDSFDLKFCVPQGSFLGPMLFSLYISELFDVISQPCQQRTVTRMIPVSIWHSIQTMIPIKTPPLQQWKRASVTSVAG